MAQVGHQEVNLSIQRGRQGVDLVIAELVDPIL